MPVGTVLLGCRVRVLRSGVALLRFAVGLVNSIAWTLTAPTVGGVSDAVLCHRPTGRVLMSDVMASAAVWRVYSMCLQGYWPDWLPDQTAPECLPSDTLLAAS